MVREADLDEKEVILNNIGKKLLNRINMEKIEIKSKCSHTHEKESLQCKLKRVWRLATSLNIKKKGVFKYSVIPEDLLMRTYYNNKVAHDLLAWMVGT